MGWIKKIAGMGVIFIILLVISVTGVQANSETESDKWRECPGIQGEYPLHEIFIQYNRQEIRNGDLTIAKCLLDGGYDPNRLNERGLPVLSYVLGQSFETVKFLLEHGADVASDPEILSSALVYFSENILALYTTPSLMERVVPYYTKQELEERFLDSEKTFFTLLEKGADLNYQELEGFIAGSSLTLRLLTDLCHWEVYSQYPVRDFFARINATSRSVVRLNSVDVEAFTTFFPYVFAQNKDGEIVKRYSPECLDLALEYFAPDNN